MFFRDRVAFCGIRMSFCGIILQKENGADRIVNEINFLCLLSIRLLADFNKLFFLFGTILFSAVSNEKQVCIE